MRPWIFIMLAIVALTACDRKPAPRPEKLTMVTLPPPPVKPPPTPPPAQPLPPEQKVVEQKQTLDPDPKPEAAKPEPVKPVDEPPPSMGSNIKGSGNDGFGLSGSGNGGRVGIGGNGGGGSPYGRYLAQVQGGIGASLRNDKRTRAAVFAMTVKVWIDNSGKITRAEPAGGQDSAAAALALVGQRVAERPPDGLPMPVVARLAARRPN